jgi:RimJ/RimL family protein N-acetyltransferase
LSVLGRGARPPRPTLKTDRLKLRGWREGDLAAFAAMNADPAVMEHFPGTLSRRESDELIERIEGGFEANGFGLWALEVQETGEFIGFTGLAVPGFEAHFTPVVEIGWRLAPSAWGKGYATEAGGAALAFGFEQGGLAEVISFASVGNRRSHTVMERLGMTHDPADDFDHPSLPPGHPQRRHVLYRALVR